MPRRLPIAGLLVGALLVAPWTASAHIEVGEKSLAAHVAEASVVVRARIETTDEVFVSPDQSVSRPVVRARVLETLKGETSFDRLVFAQHGHGVADYHAGEEALLFLDPIATHRELAALATLPGAPTHVSRQGHDEAFVLEPATRSILLAAVRDFIRAQDGTHATGNAEANTGATDEADATGGGAATGGGGSREPAALSREDRLRLSRRATLALLTSGDPQLGATALVGLGAARAVPLIEPDDVPRLEAVLRDASVSIGFRAALLVELEARGLVSGEGAWRRLLESVSGADRANAIRVAGRAGGPGVRPLLVDWVEAEDPRIATEAILALGRPGDQAAVPVLARVLRTGDARRRGAAIRALTVVATEAALGALEEAADSSDDRATQRRARAAVERLRRGEAVAR